VITSQNRATEQRERTEVVKLNVALKAKLSLGEAVRAYKNYLIRKDSKQVALFRENTAAIEKHIAEIATLAANETEKQAVTHAQSELVNYRGAMDQLVTARAASADIVQIDANLAKGIDRPLEKALGDLEAIARTSNQESARAMQTKAQRNLWLQVGVSILIAILVMTFGFLTGRKLVRRLQWFSNIISKVADNDLTSRVTVRADDELGAMGRNFNRMVDNMETIVQSVQEAVLQLANQSTVLVSGAETMANDTQDVAGQISSVATAGEEMAATSSEIAQNCSAAAGSSDNANSTARAGAQVVERTVAVMERIAERVKDSATTVESLGSRSDQIGAIIATIEDIADQTNLLALNAAIEAARAGEQGRGFAVVADEVRALAERTTKATREIGGMIKAIQQETKVAVGAMEEGVRQVENGTVEAARSGEALQEILSQIESVTMQVSQMATAAEQQTATTSEISDNIHQITEVLRRTADSARTSTDTANSLARLATTIQDDIRKFRTSGGSFRS
jgi:methyl-accepting chemotaxis protein